MPSPEPDDSLEALTHAVGRAIFADIGRRTPWPLSPGWWDERFMDLTMREEAVKVQLFRFIDVLPSLRSSAEINRHLREYFQEVAPRLPFWMRRALPHLPQDGMGGAALAGTASWNARRLARRFIAGSNVDEALGAIARLRRRSLAFTLDLLGEATITEAEAARCQAEYIALIEGLSGKVNDWPPNALIDQAAGSSIPRVNVSVKLSAIYSQFDPLDPEGTSKEVRARLRPILRTAMAAKAFVNLDMEQYAFKDLTLRIFREILDEDEFRDWSNAGIVLQAYLRDCLADLESLHAWAARRSAGVWVRLVKGAYWDFETVLAAQQGWPTPVFTEKWGTDANYEACARFLVDKQAVLHPAFASHNVRSLAYALALVQQHRVPAAHYEVQMLYGMAEPIKDVLAGMGHRVRVYTPFGQLLPGMAYLVRRLLENTANESFLRASFLDHVSEEDLLMNPLKTRKKPLADKAPIASMPGPFSNEPPTDFSRAEARASMDRALEQVRSQLGRDYLPVLGGLPRPTADFVDRVNPSHCRELVGRFGRSRPALAEEAIEIANATFPAWRGTPAVERAEHLFKAAAVMRRRRFELAAWELVECGKPRREADADVAEAIDFCEYYGREMIRLAQERRRNVPGEENSFLYEPRGVAVIIAPWNFPLAILCGMTSAAVVAGNTVIMKPAEQSTIVAAKLQEVWREAGLPAGVVQFLPGVGEEVGPVLTGHPHVALIAFTGSKPVGLALNHQAAATPPGQDHVKRVLAEMGGKNAIIVDDDADLDEAVHGVVHSAFDYSGQKCSACSRAIVLDAVHDRFLARVVEATRSLQIAPAEDPGCTVGPVIDEQAQRRIQGFLAQAGKDARLAYAGELGGLSEEGFFIAPHVFANVAPNAALAQEEIFGPVLTVLRATDLDQALAIANGTPYALTGGLYSRSPERIARVKRDFRVGNLYINRKITGALVDRQPFGGFKLSGIGSKAGGADYLLQFLVSRTITENTLRRGFAPNSESDA